MVERVIGKDVRIGSLHLTIVQIVEGPHGDILDLIATSDGEKVHLERCMGLEHGPCLDLNEKEHLGNLPEPDDPRLIFGILMFHGCAGWFCPVCRHLVHASPRETFYPNRSLRGGAEVAS